MGITGLFLIMFLVVHCAVNAAIFFDLIDTSDNGATFNRWAHFMGTNPIIRTMEIVLFAGLLLHVIDGLLLFFQNRKARPVRYAYEKASASSTWYSRSMAILGTLILFFLIVHLKDFWVKTRITELTIKPEFYYEGTDKIENLYSEMLAVFSNPPVVLLYILGCFSLFWHLLHGFRSAFQSLGLNTAKYKATISAAGDAFSVIVPIIFALMPLAMYLKWVN